MPSSFSSVENNWKSQNGEILTEESVERKLCSLLTKEFRNIFRYYIFNARLILYVNSTFSFRVISTVTLIILCTTSYIFLRSQCSIIYIYTSRRLTDLSSYRTGLNITNNVGRKLNIPKRQC